MKRNQLTAFLHPHSASTAFGLLTAPAPDWVFPTPSRRQLPTGFSNKAEPERVLFLRYEELIADPIKHVKALAEFLGVPFTDEEVKSGDVEAVVSLCSFDTLKSLPVNSTGVSDRIPGRPIENSAFFRAGKVGDWKNHLTQDMAKKLDSIVKEKLAGSGLIF